MTEPTLDRNKSTISEGIRVDKMWYLEKQIESYNEPRDKESSS